jgi:hypothetical protein
MATVQSIKASGGDYTTIQAWYNAHDGNITGDANAPYIGELYAEEYSAGATFATSTTDATHYFHLRAAEGYEFDGDLENKNNYPVVKAKIKNSAIRAISNTYTYNNQKIPLFKNITEIFNTAEIIPAITCALTIFFDDTCD